MKKDKKCDVCNSYDYCELNQCHICNRFFCELCEGNHEHIDICELCETPGKKS